MQYLPYVLLALVTVAFAVAWTLQRQSYEKILDKADLRYDTLFDRWLISKNLPPTGVDMAERHQEQQKARENKRSRVVPDRIGPVDKAQAALLAHYEDQRLHIPDGGSRSGSVS